MPIKTIKKPILEKPMFIENSFTAPFYNNVMQNELIKAVDWLKKQTIDGFTEFLAIDIINELIKENGKLLIEKPFNNFVDTWKISEEEFAALNPDI